MSKARNLGIPDILLLKMDTSGLYRTDLSIDDPGQPWATQIAAILCNSSGTITNFFYHIIKSEGRTALEKAVQVHGTSPRVADQLGVEQRRVLGVLASMLRTPPVRGMKVVTFGDFEPKIISSLLARFAVELGKPASEHDRLWLSRPLTKYIDVQKPVAQVVCKLPGEFGDDFRWPTFDEASQVLLGRPARAGEHNAFEDILTLKELYFELARRGYYERDRAEAEPA